MKILLGLLIAIACLTPASAVAQPLHLVLTPSQKPTDLLAAGDEFGQALAKLYGAPVRVTVASDYAAVIEALRNRTAEGQLGHALIEGKRIATQREQLEQLIQVDVRNALQSLTTAAARLRSAAVARESAEQQYESEKRKLDAGQSTVFFVLERQTALATARGNELRAQTDLNKAIAELQRATGNSLAANNVSVAVH